MENALEESAVSELMKEQESIDVSITIEEDGEILENFVNLLNEEWSRGFNEGFPTHYFSRIRIILYGFCVGKNQPRLQ